MKTKLMLAYIMLVSTAVIWGNPVPPAELISISATPPAIEFVAHYVIDSIDISGYMIYTSEGTAIINPGTYVPYNPDGDTYFLLDSTNTSGFVIDAEHDSIFTDIEIYQDRVMYDYCSFGSYDETPAPPKGHCLCPSSYRTGPYPDFWSFCFTLDFARWDPGYTDIVVNEVSSHCTWGDGCNFIELYNLSDDDISLDGFKLVCDTIYDLPADAYIPAHGYYVINDTDFPSIFDMDFDLDNLYLVNPIPCYPLSGNRIVDQVGWSSDHGENISFMRFPDGDVDSTEHMYDFRGYSDESSTTFENGFPTRGAANRHDSPGFVVIGAQADSIDEGSARVHWTDPIWDESFDYSVLVSNDDHFPQTYDDGDIIYQGADQLFDDSSIPPVGPIFYTVFAHNGSGGYSTPTGESQTYIYFNSVGIDEPNLPTEIGYLSCYPNPFNAQTTISYQLPRQAAVCLEIYDILGQRVQILVEKVQPSGSYDIVWDASEVSSGIYFARLRVEGNIKTTKLVLLK